MIITSLLPGEINMKKINIIVSISNNNCIGDNNTLLWKQSNDLLRFKELTENNIVIMGQKTYESLPFKPLKNRTNIVISNDYNINYDNCIMSRSIEESIEKSENIDGDIFIIGGGSIYKQFLPLSDTLYITRIDVDIEGDTYFPDIDLNRWDKVSSEYHKKDDKNQYNYTYEVYELKTETQ